MTTIVYRAGVMAADSGVWIGDVCYPWARKLVRDEDGTLYGITGNAGAANAFIEWIDGGKVGDPPKAEALPDDRSSFVVMVAAKGKPIRLITSRGDEVYDAPYFAIGAGAAGAACAMFVGASAEEAINAAIAHAPGAMGPVQTLTHEG